MQNQKKGMKKLLKVQFIGLLLRYTGATTEEQPVPQRFTEEANMKDFDFGYFGVGDEGYAQYQTAFDRIFGADDAGDDRTESEASWDNAEDDF